MKRVWQVWDVAVALIVAAFVLWLLGSSLAAAKNWSGPLEPGDCEYPAMCR